MDSLRILTVRQPWAWSIIYAGKDVENRVRNIAGDYRGPVAIHAGKVEAPRSSLTLALGEACATYRPTTLPDVWPWQENFGSIIGVADLVDVHRGYASFGCSIDEAEVCEPPCSRWAQFSSEQTLFHLVLANPRPLAEPIPFKGALGLRRLPDDVAEIVWKAVA